MRLATLACKRHKKWHHSRFVLRKRGASNAARLAAPQIRQRAMQDQASRQQLGRSPQESASRRRQSRKQKAHTRFLWLARIMDR